MKTIKELITEKRNLFKFSNIEAENYVCQQIIVNKIANSEMADKTLFKGGVVMFNMTKNVRRTTRDIDFDLLHYDIFDEEFFKSVNIIVDLFVTEQNHFEKSPYRFFRNTDRYDDTIHNNGMGAEVKYTGMTWSGFRPSDDACVYGYLIPSNLFAVTVLRKLLKLPKEILNDKMLIEKATKLADEIEGGIQKYGIVEHPKYGKIYAYETDGMGNFVFMDDANVPSLIALPYIGCCDIDDEIYQNTRKFVLSEDNPYYFEGKEISGLGSPHTPKGFVWHIGLSLQGLTSNDKEERLKILRMLEKSDGDTGFMHEGVNSDNTKEFTRPWFAWSNSIFSEFLLDMVDEI